MGGDVANLSPKARGADRDFQSNKVRCLTWRTEESAIRIMRMEGLLLPWETKCSTTPSWPTETILKLPGRERSSDPPATWLNSFTVGEEPCWHQARIKIKSKESIEQS